MWVKFKGFPWTILDGLTALPPFPPTLLSYIHALQYMEGFTALPSFPPTLLSYIHTLQYIEGFIQAEYSRSINVRMKISLPVNFPLLLLSCFGKRLVYIRMCIYLNIPYITKEHRQ